MKRALIFLLFIPIILSCSPKKQEKENNYKANYIEIIKTEYELHKPNTEPKAVLILFGGYPELATDVKREFTILDVALQNDIAVVLLNYNRKLWLQESEKQALADSLSTIFKDNQLPTTNVYIGGFSNGGVISLLISNFIKGLEKFYFHINGVFIVDSPIDLLALYKSSEKNIDRNFSESSTQESKWLLETLRSNFGEPKNGIYKYEEYSVFTYKTNNTSNLENLKNTKIRLYTEPDTLWWKEYRMADYDQMNAFYIKKLNESLQSKNFNYVEYITTVNKGYRANGERHPHSWAIVDKNNLINWILTE